MHKKHKKVFRVLNYSEHLLILMSYIEHLLIFLKLLDAFSISGFASLVCIPIGIMSSAIGLKVSVITAAIKKNKSIIKKKKKIAQ